MSVHDSLTMLSRRYITLLAMQKLQVMSLLCGYGQILTVEAALVLLSQIRLQ